MARSRSKNRILLFFLVTALVVLALYGLHFFEPRLRAHFAPEAVAATEEAKLAAKKAAENFHMVMNIVGLVLWMILAILITRALSAILFGIFFRQRRGYEAPVLIRNTFSVVAYIAGFIIIFKAFYPEVGLGALFTTSAVLGAIIGLALQDTLGNFFAGISVHADKPFQVGDVIAVGAWTGVVESITWRAVKIRTFANHIVLASHSSISKESIDIAPRDNLNARIVFFNTLYTDSPAKTIHIVREAVREADNVSPKITPIVRIRALGDSAIDWEVKYWLIDYAKYNDTDALVRQRIWYAFRRAGIHFAFPTRTLHIARQPKTDGVGADGSGFIDRLSAVDIFAPLSTEETARLAAASVSHVFAPGESVIHAGDEVAGEEAPSLKPTYVEELEARTRAAEQKVADVQSRFEQLRSQLQRETDETRQRLNRAADERARRDKGEFVSTLLPVADNLQRAIDAAEQGGSLDALLNGVRGTLSSFENALAAAGLEPVAAVGEQFDPELHEAVDTVEVEPERDGTVTAEYSRGYKIGDRLLRPARVQVGRAQGEAKQAAE